MRGFGTTVLKRDTTHTQTHYRPSPSSVGSDNNRSVSLLSSPSSPRVPLGLLLRLRVLLTLASSRGLPTNRVPYDGLRWSLLWFKVEVARRLEGCLGVVVVEPGKFVLRFGPGPPDAVSRGLWFRLTGGFAVRSPLSLKEFARLTRYSMMLVGEIAGERRVIRMWRGRRETEQTLS